MTKAYQITSKGIDAASGGFILFDKDKFDNVDVSILRVLMGDEGMSQYLSEQIEKRIKKLERKGYVMLVDM